MARLHSSLGDRTSYTVDGVAKAQGLPAKVYEDPAGTVPANLATYDPTNVTVPGAAIPGAALTVDAYSNRPAFWDLNDRNVLYITGNGGPLEPIHPDAQPQLTDIAARVGAVEDIAGAAETPEGAQAKADAAQAAAATDAASKITAHIAAADPHGDRAYTNTGLAGRVPVSRAVTAGAGLTGGGDLSADRSLAVAGLTSAHFAPASVDGAAGVAGLRTLGTGAQQAAAGANALSRQLVTAKGDLLVATAAGVVARLPVGADGATPVADSGRPEGVKWALPASLLGEVVADVLAVNSVAETPLVQFTLPTNLPPGSVLRLHAAGDYLNNTGASANTTCSVKLGSTVLLTATPSQTANALRRRWVIDALIHVTATGQVADGVLDFTQAASGTLALNSLAYQGTGTASEDLSTAKALTLTAQHATAAPTLEMRVRQASLMLLPKAG